MYALLFFASILACMFYGAPLAAEIVGAKVSYGAVYVLLGALMAWRFVKLL